MKRRSFLQALLAIPAAGLVELRLGQLAPVKVPPAVAAELGGDVEVALFTADGEVSGSGYARAALDDAGYATFPTCTGSDWGLVESVVIMTEAGSVVIPIAPKHVQWCDEVRYGPVEVIA